MAANNPEFVSYQQIPLFGRLGKVFVDSAPQGSGRNAQLNPTSSGSTAAFTSPMGGGTSTPPPGGDCCAELRSAISRLESRLNSASISASCSGGNINITLSL